MAGLATSYTLPSSSSSPPRRSSQHTSADGPSLTLPSLSLGSLMDVDYFDSIGRTPQEMETKQKSPSQPLSSVSPPDPHAPTASFYASTVQGVQNQTSSPLTTERRRSMSSEGRVWKPRADAITSPSTTATATFGPGKQPNTPPTQDVEPLPTSSPVQALTSPPDPGVESSSPPVSPSQRPLSYLPPGAASPHHLRQGSASFVVTPPAAAATPSSMSVPSRTTSSGPGITSNPIPSPDPNPIPNPRRGSSSGPPISSSSASQSQSFQLGTPSSAQPQSLPPGAREPSISRRETSNAASHPPSMYTAPSSPPPNEPLPLVPVVDRGFTSSPNREPEPASLPGSRKPPLPTTQPQIRMSSSPKPLPLNQAGPYPSFPNTALVPPSRPGPGRPVVVEEVCIECMMRDRDMADVDVTGQGVWERESDVWYDELVRREKDDELRGRPEQVSTNGKTRPKAKGGKLLEESVKVWLTMNPKEPQARWQTLEAYIKSQTALLQAEAVARAQAQRESQQMDTKLKENFSVIRRSGYEVTPNPTSHALPIRVAPAPAIGSPEKDATLLENGLIVERVDLKKEEREEKARSKQRRRGSSAAFNDGVSVYGASLYSGGAPSPTFDNSSTGMLAVQGQPHGQNLAPYQSGSLSPVMDKRASSAYNLPLNSPRPMMQRGVSQASIETTGTNPVKRFFGAKHWGNASQASLAISGSMMDMHLGLDQDRRGSLAMGIPYDLSAPPSLDGGDPWAHQQQRTETDVISADDRSGTVRSKKKSKGLGKLWKLMTGQGSKERPEETVTRPSVMVEEDLSAPLAPPPPLSYLVRDGRSRHNSTSSLNAGAHPRSVSAPGMGGAQSMTGVSPPTAPSSMLPSPTSNRWRDSGSVDDRDPRHSVYRDDTEVDLSDPQDDRRSPTFSQHRASATSPGAYPVEKNLPPIPPDGHMSGTVRPSTMLVNHHAEGELVAPRAPFRNDMRRQSFNGVNTNFNRQTWVVPEDAGFLPPPSIGQRYDEFGGSRRSLGKFEDVRSSTLPPKRNPEKTRSRFGLSALFSPSKKHQASLPPTIYLGGESNSNTLVGHRRDQSIAHSSFSDLANQQRSNNSHNPRASVASSKKLAMITQDEDFVAYRYPSQSQTLPLQR